MRERISNLKYLTLSGNNIDDECLQALVPGLCNNKRLERLVTPDQIAAVGLRSLSPFSHSSSCSLHFLNLRCMRFGAEQRMSQQVE